MRTTLLLTAVGIASLGAVDSAAADTILLRTAVRAMRDDGMVLLRDVAELRGPEVSRYAELVIASVPLGSPPKEIGVEEIRRRMEQAGANWASIDLEGRRVLVRPRSSDALGAPKVCAPASVEPQARRANGETDVGAADDGAGSVSHRAGSSSDRDGASNARAGVTDGRSGAAGFSGSARRGNAIAATTPTNSDSSARRPTRRDGRRTASDPVLVASVLGENSVRALVGAAIKQALDEDGESIRLSFDGLDATTLAETPPGVRIEIDPIGILDADRVEFAVRWWRDGRVERRSGLSVFPEVARTAAVAPRDLRKGDRPDGSEWSNSLCWVKPSERDRVVRPGAVGGRAVGTTLREGEPLLESHLERALLIRRGDRIVVRTTVGTLAVSVDAVAQSDGREGESIECVRMGSPERRDRSTISAIVTGRGEAVVRSSATTM